MKIYIPEPIAEAGEKYLEFQGYEIFRGSGQTDKESLIRDIAECDAMILRTAKMDEEVLENGKKLRIVARHGAGYDNLDVKAAKKRGIITTYSPDTTALSVAEMTITLLLMLAKKVKRMETELRKDNFSYKFSHKGMDVSGKTLGIIGLGKIGKMVAKKAAIGLDMKVISYIPRPEGKEIPEYVKAVPLEQLLKESDFISLHVPGGAKNQNLIGKKELEQMKESAFLLNLSRGGVVNESEFAEAVRKKQIAGGALDVFAKEPPEITDDIFKLENVILTPHIGSNTEECMERIAMDVAKDVDLVLSGEDPRHPIRQ